jgi:NagD protein
MTPTEQEEHRMPKAYLIDMDGVLIRGLQAIPGATAFIDRLQAVGAPFLVLTNNSFFTPRDHQARLQGLGFNIPVEAIFTSALATAHFLHQQRPQGSAYVVGEAGLTTALHDIGYIFTEHAPEYVVLGETVSYSFERLSTALRLVAAGARFIATNPDVIGPSEQGVVLACGAVAAMIAAATGVRPYFVGKPNPLMMRSALRHLGAHSEDAVMIGDRMDTDIVTGTESGMETILVLSGVTRRDEVERFPYRPTHIVDSVAALKP